MDEYKFYENEMYTIEDSLVSFVKSSERHLGNNGDAHSDHAFLLSILEKVKGYNKRNKG